MADKRIIELNTVNALTEDDYVMIDNATNGTAKVKATLFGGGVDYSTTEQDTGERWIDGKTIYKKTIILENAINLNPSGTSLPSSAFTGMNIENVINSMAHRLVSDGRDGVANIPTSLWIYNGTYSIYSLGTWSGVYTITVRYTKTTDTV